VRLTVSRGPRKLGRLLLLVEHLLALAVQEEERGGVNLGQAHAVTRIDAEAAERALFRLEHHCRRAKTRESQRGGRVPSRTTRDPSSESTKNVFALVWVVRFVGKVKLFI